MNKHRMALAAGLTLIGGLASAWAVWAQTGTPAMASSGAVQAQVAVDVVFVLASEDHAVASP